MKYFNTRIDIRSCVKLSVSKSDLIHYGWLLLIVLTYLYKVFRHIDAPIAPDAAGVYLPFSKMVLEQGFEFLMQPKSIIVPPISYLWPALFGGDVTVVKYANLVAGIFMALLIYGIGRQLHTRLAGLIAAFLFATSPFLISWIPTALSEPPFFLFTLIWLWGIGEIISGKAWAIPVAAIALSLSILTRSIWFYPSILFLAFALFFVFFKLTIRKNISDIALALALGLILPVIIIIKNIVFFGLPAIDSGSGGALFYGANLMTNGFEPPLLGLAYESGFNDFHSLIGNREHASVALQFLKERSLLELGNWYLTKVSWVTLFTALEAPTRHSLLRVFELAMAGSSIWYGIKQKNMFILVIGFGLILQILQTAFVLYNIRYSTDNLELLLIPLAAVGITLSLNLGTKTIENVEHIGVNKSFFYTHTYGLIGAAILVMLSAMLYFRAVPTVTLPPNIPVEVLFDGASALTSQHVAFSDDHDLTSYKIEFDVPKQVLPLNVGNVLWEIKMTIFPAVEGHCNKASINFKLNSTAEYAQKSGFKFRLHDDAIIHRYLIGASSSNSKLFPIKPGKLILKFDCTAGSKIVVNNISLIAPHFIEYYFKK
ncbi:MAG: glycosyltransferase family 39 protein [Methylotenera sp.]|nr:glycosyltransferase family 39 protein [Methylotenera sp.]